MAHFAYVVDGIVNNVYVVANAVITDDAGVEHESIGQQFLSSLFDLPSENFIQCSYNGAFRGHYPGLGWSYRADLDAFIPLKPAPNSEVAEWVLNEETFTWEPVEV